MIMTSKKINSFLINIKNKMVQMFIYYIIKKYKEVLIFLVIGSLTVLIDYLFYIFFNFLLELNTLVSKGGSFIIGAIFSYYGNNKWTFSFKVIEKYNILNFIILYLISLLVNVYLNQIILLSFTNLLLIREIAFLLSTLVSALINYLGMKYYVFNKKLYEGIQ